MIEAAWALGGFAAGLLAAWLLRQSRESALRESKVRTEAELAAARASIEEQKRLLQDAEGRLENAFKALASDALKSSNESFLKLAQQVLEKHVAQAQGDLDQRRKAVEDLVKPIGDALKSYTEKADLLEKERQNAYGGLTQLLQSVAQTSERLKTETGALVSALRRPNVRGQWGEFTLRRVVELAGMTQHVDFAVQESAAGAADERLQRPDLVVHLPNGRDVVVDSKAVADAYFEAMEAATEEARKAALERHAANLREQVRALSGKRYWERFAASADFVVLFVPAEPILDAAVQQAPSLLEEAMLGKVVVATPTTLVALLKAVAYGWRQEKMAENAREVAEQGRRLLDAVAVWAGHYSKLRGAVFDVVQAFNATQGSMERNVLPKIAKMRELGVSSMKDMPPLPEPVAEAPRPVDVPKVD
jgi:DNA recombination protein RmuC